MSEVGIATNATPLMPLFHRGSSLAVPLAVDKREARCVLTTNHAVDDRGASSHRWRFDPDFDLTGRMGVVGDR